MYDFLLSTFYFLLSRRRGQSLVEVLIAVSVGAILIMAAASVIAPSLKVNTQSYHVQIGAVLARELAENVRVWAEGDWHLIAGLTTSSANHYYLATSQSPFTSVSGNEAIIVATTTYTRYFYVDDAYRDAGDAVTASGGTSDPSTKLVTVEYSWSQSATSAIVLYVTRNRGNAFWQTDWSAGPGQDGPATSTNAGFLTSSNIDAISLPGSIKMSGISTSDAGAIDSIYGYAWAENIGWVDFKSTGNVFVNSTQLQGYANSTYGYVALDCATSPNGNICGSVNFHITNDGAGNLSGWAWNDQFGWISFNCDQTGSGGSNQCGYSTYKVTINSSGYFSGWAWSDQIGWISFNCSNTGTCGTVDYKVKTTWTH